jgi:ABC-type multidrug transport system ATPase subunit
MRISSVSVRGYRTIKDEIAFDLDHAVTLVGPNNSGKTNTLKALHAFFTGYDNELGYDFETDICAGERSLRTNVQVTLSKIDPDADQEIFETIVDIHEALDVSSGGDDTITLYLTFSPNSNPSYRVFPNVKRPKGSDGVAYSRLERKLFDLVFANFSIHYIPSEKSITDLYRNLVLPFVFRRIHKVLEPHISEIKDALDASSDDINGTLDHAGLGDYKASFELPDHPDEIFRNMGFNLKDTNVTSVFSKGMGIQSAVLLASFCWIARQETEAGKSSLWLLEEPESYLHPELASQCLSLLKKLGQESQVIMTTHSLGFVPQNPLQSVGLELEDGWTRSTSFKTYHEATKKIRQSLGVRFSDYYNFSEYNILVEGQTDRQYFEHVLSFLKQVPELCQAYPILTSNKISIHDYGGVKGLEGFLRAAFEFVSRERPLVAVFDGDSAGEKARRDLNQFFGRKEVPFQANANYIIVRDRFQIEGLLPDVWLQEIYDEHPGWFDDFPKDAQGQILPFSVKDSRKEQFLGWFKGRSQESHFDEWASHWKGILDVLEESLSKQGSHLYG